VIVVDDCSEDGSGAILDRLGKEDPRLRVISGGGAPARLDGEGPCDRLGLPGLGGGLIQGGDTWHASLLLSGVIALLEHSDASFATSSAASGIPDWAFIWPTWACSPISRWSWTRSVFAIPAPPQSLVNGQYLAFWRTAYEALGTHRAVRCFSSTDASLGYLAKHERYLPAIFDAGEADLIDFPGDRLSAM
jgi:glycosyltransferase involved in cell wall biosynthesis